MNRARTVTFCSLLLVAAAGRGAEIATDQAMIAGLPTGIEAVGQCQVAPPTAPEMDELSGVAASGGTEGNPSYVFTQAGEFLKLDSRGQPEGYFYKMQFPTTQSFKKIILDFDVFIGEFGGSVNCTYHNRYQYINFWLQADNIRYGWQDNLLAYNIFWNDSIYEIQSTAFAAGFFTFHTNCRPAHNTWHHTHYEFDGPGGSAFASLSQGGQEVCRISGPSYWNPIKNDFFALGFGIFESGCKAQADSDPGGITSNWRWANMKIQFIGDQPPPPAGPRARRRQ